MRRLLVQCLTVGFLWSLPMVGAFDMSVNTNVSRLSAEIPSSSRFVLVSHVSDDVCSACRHFELNDALDTGARILMELQIQVTLPVGSNQYHTIAMWVIMDLHFHHVAQLDLGDRITPSISSQWHFWTNLTRQAAYRR